MHTRGDGGEFCEMACVVGAAAVDIYLSKETPIGVILSGIKAWPGTGLGTQLVAASVRPITSYDCADPAKKLRLDSS